MTHASCTTESEVLGLRYCEEAVGRALADSSVPREELFVTTKQVRPLLHDRSWASRQWL